MFANLLETFLLKPKWVHKMKPIKYVLLSVLLAIAFYSCKKEAVETKAQETAIHYLFHPALISDTLSRILWHPDIDFRGLDQTKKLLYFIAKKQLKKSEMLQLLTIDSNLIEYAPCDSGICEFGGMRGKIDGYYAFRIPTKNLKVDTGKVLYYKYFETKMAFPFTELMQELDTSYFNNYLKAVNLSVYFEHPTFASNIGAYISKRNTDKAIKKLAEKITAGKSSNEEKAQALLQFVTNTITYSYEDLWYESEIVKRAHEVLLSGDGDCSAKTTLYASLLEQCAIPYCLLYFQNHVNVGVLGNFAEENGYIQTIKDKRYAIAETTSENFIIGKTKLSNDALIKKLLFYQMPSTSADIMDAKTHEPFQLLDAADE